MFVRLITVRFFALNKLMVVYLAKVLQEIFPFKKNLFIRGKIFDLGFVEFFIKFGGKDFIK